MDTVGLWGMRASNVLSQPSHLFSPACHAPTGPLIQVIVSVLSIGLFNFFGLSVTRALSGASRATIDATRTLLVSSWLPGWTAARAVAPASPPAQPWPNSLSKANGCSMRAVAGRCVPILSLHLCSQVWLISMAMGWETFHQLQLLGFVVLIAGLCGRLGVGATIA